MKILGLLSGEGREAVGGEDLGLLVLEERRGALPVPLVNAFLGATASLARTRLVSALACDDGRETRGFERREGMAK